MPQIRFSTATDRERILYINRLSWQAAYTHIFSPAEISALFKGEIHQAGTWLDERKERIGTLIAIEDEKIIGFIGMAELKTAGEAEISTFYLLPELQGKGIGTLLWNAALEHLREEGYKAIWVWVLEKAEARHFYAARGAKEKVRGVYRVGEHEEVALGFYLDLGDSSSP